MYMLTIEGQISTDCSTFDGGSSDVWATNIQKS